jgi:hyaluronoglucosaminidase
MTNHRTTAVLTAALACLTAHTQLCAQETVEFDLASQRSEVQNVLPVPGHKIDHQGLVINPTPHKLTLGEGSIDVARGFALKDKQGKFADDLGFATLDKGGTKLTIDFGKKLAAKQGVKAVSGAYVLSITPKGGVVITGYDERGAFYGLQTLRQLLERNPAGEGKLPIIDINDYPDLPNRGVVEGFYGNPWSHEVRLALIDFYGKHKMNSYLYGPKDDPYHSCPNWRQPYPAKEAENIKQLVDRCNRNRVDFVWAIHPGQDIKWNEEDYNNLVNKFNMMYDLGVRHFAIFFDDISGEGTNPLRQTELLNRLTDDFVNAKGDVSPLTICPTDYSQMWANPTENGSLAIYGRTLNPDVKVFWTGALVCSDLTPETLHFINSRIKRPAYYWWNYPVTDYCRRILMQGPVYGLDTKLTSNDLCGLISNPMEHGEASMLALYSVADYAWNMADYNPIDSWERGLAELMPGAADAYRTFAIHSADTETGYRRDESWETKTFRMANWTDEAAAELEAEFERVAEAPALIEAGCANKMLYAELKPWLTEFAKLGERGKKTIALGRIFRADNDDALFWQSYVANLMSADDLKAYNTHKSGTMKLQPFYENAMDDMAHAFVKKLAGTTPTDYKGIGSFGNSTSIQTKLMLDNDTTTHYTSGYAQKAGDWIGLDLRDVRDLKELSIRQGRNSKDDVDYFDHAIVEYSADGRTWSPLTGELTKQYVIDWKGEPVKARYVRLKRLDSQKTNYAAVRTFTVNPVRLDELGYGVKTADAAEAAKAFDLNPSTAYRLDGQLEITVPAGVKGYTLLMSAPESAMTIKQYDKKGKLLAESTAATAFAKVDVADKAATITIDGNADIFEVITNR